MLFSGPLAFETNYRVEVYYPILILLALVFQISCGIARSAATLTDEKIIAKLGKSAYTLVDSSGDLNIRQVTSPRYSAEFRPSRETSPNLGYRRSAVWVRFTLKNLTFSEQWILQAAYPDMDNVEFYHGAASNWAVQELGQSLPFSSRKIMNRNLLFPLSLPFGEEKTFYLRYQNTTGMTIPLRLYSSQQYQTYALEEQLVFGIFFGFMLVLSLYNLILYAKVRESGYLHYFMYIAAYGMFQFSLYGLAQQYLWPDTAWWSDHNAPLFLASAFFSRILFTMSVLDSRENTPRLHKVLKVLLAAPILFAAYHGSESLELLPSVLVPGPVSGLGMAALYFAAFTIVIFLINVRCLGKKIPAAKTFLIAWIFMVSGLLVFALKSLGFVPSNIFTEYSILFGTVGEMCLLFISLGESIRAIKSEAQEKHLRQQAAIHAFQEEQIRSMRLELELLKANIHPHFMLNSINAAIMWIKEDPGIAEKLLHALSGELKLLLKIVGEKVIPIADEIGICRLHLEVMSLRHDKKFTLRQEGIAAGESIPPMVFHTLVENGVTHGYAGKDAGIFILSRSENNGAVHFTLFNDGEAEKNHSESGGLGLKYVRARLEEAYGRRWRLESHPVEGGWIATISIEKEDLTEPDRLPVETGAIGRYFPSAQA